MVEYSKKIFFFSLIVVCVFLIFCIRGDYTFLQKQLSLFYPFVSLIAERTQVEERAQITTLNHAIPPARFLKAVLSGEELTRDMILGYNGLLGYYQKVIQYFPDNADAYALLGFCYNYLGDAAKAERFYKKSILLNPDFFWAYYNLAVLYLHQGRNVQASENFHKARQIDPTKTLESIYTSKVYQQILQAYQFPYDAKEELKKGYQKCAVAQALIISKLISDEIKQKIVLQRQVF